MENRSKETAAKILSLMGRMEHIGSYDERLTESYILKESTRANVGTFLEFMTKYAINKGPFIHLGYIKLYPTDTAYPTDDYYKKVTDTRGDIEDNSRNLSRFDKWTDKVGNLEWNNPTGKKAAGKDIHAMGNKLYNYIIKLTDYNIHWQANDVYNKKSKEASAGVDAAKEAMQQAINPETLKAAGLPVPKAPSPDDEENGEKARPGYYLTPELAPYDIYSYFDRENGDENGKLKVTPGQYRTDIDDENSVQAYDRYAIKNYLSDPNDTGQKAFYFGVDEEGNIDPLPTNLGKLLYNKSRKKLDLDQIEDEGQRELAQKFLDAEKLFDMSNKQWLVENVAYICGVATAPGCNKESVYWINPNPLFLLSKKKTVNKQEIKFQYNYGNIDGEQLKAIMAKYAKSESDEIEAEANGNVQGQSLVSAEEE